MFFQNMHLLKSEHMCVWFIDVDECSSNPCNKGDCTDKINGYECTCPHKFIDAHCKFCKFVNAWLYIVIAWLYILDYIYSIISIWLYKLDYIYSLKFITFLVHFK